MTETCESCGRPAPIGMYIYDTVEDGADLTEHFWCIRCVRGQRQ